MDTCRTCGEYINKIIATNLFEDSKRILVHQIEVLTGLWLEIQENMSNFICSHCQRDLNQAVEFRERCITTQMALQEQQQQSQQQSKEANNALQHDDVDDGSLSNVTKLAFDDIDVDSIQLALHFSQHNSPITFMTSRDEMKGNEEEGAALDDEQEQGDEIFSNEIILEENITEEKAIDNIENNASGIRENRKDVEKTLKKRKKWQKDAVCEQCGKKFTNASNFKLHMLRHAGKKNYQCRCCGDKFYTRHFLRRHKRKHTDERPFPCKYCDRKFRTWSNRIDHERSHTNERPYQCSHCDKSFYTCSIRKEHELVHTGVRNFCCTVCNQWFLRRTHLSTHCRSKIHKQRELQQPQPEPQLQVDAKDGI